MIERDEDSNKKVLVTLLTTRRNSMDMFILYNKQSSFTLKKTADKYTEAQRESGESLLYTYQGLNPKDELALMGLYVMVGEKGSDEKLFDCFLSQNKMGMKNSPFYFQVYKGIHHEMDDIARKAMAESKFGFAVHLKSIFIATGVVLGLGLAFGVLLFWVKSAGKHNDGADQPKKHEDQDSELEQKE